MNWNDIVFYLALAGIGIVLLIVAYYAFQIWFFKTRVDYFESKTDINVPLLAPTTNRSDNSVRTKIQNVNRSLISPINRIRGRMNAPYSRAELNQKSIKELNQLYRKHVDPELSENTVIPKKRAINALQARDSDISNKPLVMKNDSSLDGLKVKKLSIVYEPINAPKSILNKLRGTEAPSKRITYKEAVEAHEARSKLSQEKDENQWSNKVKSKPTQAWKKNPGRSDVIGIDTPGSTHKRRHELKSLMAPKFSLVTNKMKAPISKFNNMGKGKGAVISAREDEGDIKTSVIATTSFQIKDAKAESLDDGSLVLDITSKSGRKHTILAQANTDKELK